MENDIDPMEKFGYAAAVANVGNHQLQLPAGGLREVLATAVCKVIQYHYAGTPRQKLAGEFRTDKAGAPGDKHIAMRELHSDLWRQRTRYCRGVHRT